MSVLSRLNRCAALAGPRATAGGSLKCFAVPLLPAGRGFHPNASPSAAHGMPPSKFLRVCYDSRILHLTQEVLNQTLQGMAWVSTHEEGPPHRHSYKLKHDSHCPLLGQSTGSIKKGEGVGEVQWEGRVVRSQGQLL